MKSEQEVRDRLEQLEQLRDVLHEEGDRKSELDVLHSIRQLRWVLDQEPMSGSGRARYQIEREDDTPPLEPGTAHP